MTTTLPRITCPKVCREVTDKHPDYFTFDVEDWFSKPENYALKDGDNIGFAEHKSPGVYWVHFCFDTARGRAALDLALACLRQLHKERNVRMCIGLISEGNKKARWVVRQIGFKSLGLQDTGKNGICEMFYWQDSQEQEQGTN